MVENHLRTTIQSGNVSLGTRTFNTWPGIIEVIGQTDAFDYVEFLGEYAPWTLEDLENLSRAAELSGLSTMIKVDESNREFAASRAIAAGIQNILFADVRTVADAREAVAAVRAEPVGNNGLRPGRWDRYVTGYLDPNEFVRLCDEAVIGIMVEKESTVENLESILAVEGIDMVQFGPVDYSLSVGEPGLLNTDEMDQIEADMIQTALEMGVHPRAEIYDLSSVDRYLELGVRDFNYGIDLGILYAALSADGSEFRAKTDTIER